MESKLSKTIFATIKASVKNALLGFVYICLFSAVSYAGGTGGQPGQFLAWGAGARALGMGNAFFSVSDDASATYWNPAGMTQLDRKELMALHVTLFADTSYDFISYVHPTANLGVFGVNLTRLYSGGFEKVAITYDSYQQDIIDLQTLGTFDDTQLALTTAYAKKIKENISVGVSMKYITHTLDTSTNGFVTFDTTFLMNGLGNNIRGLNIGLGIQNLLSTAFGDTEDKLPLIFKLGASQSFMRNKLLVSLGIDQNVNANMEWHIGSEYWVINFACLRIGFQGDGGEGIRETTAGFGVKYKDYGLDYAFGLHDLGMSHRVSGSWRFGPSINQNRDALIKRYLQEGIEAYSKGNFLLAFKRIEKALDIDQGSAILKKMFARIQTVTGFLQTAAGESEEMVAIRKGVAGFLENEDKTAVNAFRYAFYKNPKNMKLLGLLNTIEKEFGITRTESQKDDLIGFTILDQKVYDARQAILDGKYDQALIKCQEILNLEPKNITALEMMGSALFMMDQPEKARVAWMKVLEVDPTNKVVPEFLNQLRR